MHQIGRGARRKLGFTPWMGTLSALAVCAPLGCAEYQPSQQPSDDVAGLQAEAGVSGSLPAGGSVGTGAGGRDGSETGSAGASQMAVGGESSEPPVDVAGGSPSFGQGGRTSGAGTGGEPTMGASGAASAGHGGYGGMNSAAGRGNSGTAGNAGSGNAGSGSAGSGSAGSGNAGSGSLAPIDLSHGKSAAASSEQVGNEAPNGNDASLTTRWCAAHGTFPQWWRVDLGASHRLNDFSVQFEKSAPKYSYKIETSNDDAVYTTQATISGAGVPQSDKFMSGISARYVRITLTAADPWSDSAGSHPTWASFWDFSVTGW